MPDNYPKATVITPSDTDNQYYDGIYVGGSGGANDLRVSMWGDRNQGQATTKITFHGTSAGIDNKWLQVVDTRGKSRYYQFDTNGSSADTGTTVGSSADWVLVGLGDAGTTALVAAEFAAAFGSTTGHGNGEITATVSGGIVSLIQVMGGRDGNTPVTGGIGPGQTGTIVLDFGATAGFSVTEGITIVDNDGLIKHFAATGASWSDGGGSGLTWTGLSGSQEFGITAAAGAAGMSNMLVMATDLKSLMDSTQGFSGSISSTISGTGDNVLMTLITTTAGGIGTAITEDLSNFTIGGATQWDKAEGEDLSGVAAGGSWGARGASWEDFKYGDAGVCMDFKNVDSSAQGILPIKVCRVWNTGTSAINLVGFNKFGE